MTWVLITGATGGIGRDAALRGAAMGLRVIATGRRDEALAALGEEAKARGLSLTTVRLDVADPASVLAAKAEIDARTGGYGVDALVNNAGYGEMGPLELLDGARVAAMFETNVTGVARVTRAFLPAMRERRRGRVINVSSVLGRTTIVAHGAYAATKHALEAMSDALRLEVAPFGVKVSVIEPGSIATDFGARAFGALSALPDDPAWAAMVERVARLEAGNQRMSASPEVVSRAILRACTEEDPPPRVAVPALAGLQITAARLAPRGIYEPAMRYAMGLSSARSRSSDGAARPIERLALVTGGAGGIGRATAFRLAKAGFVVLATDVDERALADLGRTAREQRLSIETARMDVTDPASIAAVADAVEARRDGAGLSALVNNAGYAEVGPIELVDDRGWQNQLAVNVEGLLNVTRAFAPAMRRGGRGRIANISSILGVVSFPFLGVYCASKHAVEALTDALRLELGAFGIGVSAVQPAFIRSGFAETAKRSLARYDLEHSAYRAVAGQMETIIDRLDRLGGEPDDVARAVHRAVTERDPSARYRTPLSAAIAARTLPWLPTRAADYALGRFFGMGDIARSRL